MCSGGNRKKSFVGGVDLASARYDDLDHRLDDEEGVK